MFPENRWGFPPKKNHPLKNRGFPSINHHPFWEKQNLFLVGNTPPSLSVWVCLETLKLPKLLQVFLGELEDAVCTSSAIEEMDEHEEDDDDEDEICVFFPRKPPEKRAAESSG